MLQYEKNALKMEHDWKIELIEDMNPSWADFSTNWNLDFRKLRG